MKKLKIFETHGKRKIQLVIDQIDDFSENHYEIAGVNYTHKDGVIEAGYNIFISGKVSEYWVDGIQKSSKELRTSLKLLSQNPIHQGFEKGIFGSGEFESEKSLFMEISVEPWIVKDITHELRFNKERGFRVDGYLLSDKAFLNPRRSRAPWLWLDLYCGAEKENKKKLNEVITIAPVGETNK